MTPLEATYHLCKQLRLTSLGAVVPEALTLAQQQDGSLESFLLYLLAQEAAQRHQRRIDRYLRQAQRPPGKTLAPFDLKRLPLRLRRQIPWLVQGEFIPQADNLLLFGSPGTGKTHLAAALGFEWLQRGYPVFFTPTFKWVDTLLRAKRDDDLERELKRLDRFPVIILDDFGYVQQSRQEMAVLFTFLAERYERRSVVITSNLVFSPWNQIFHDPLTTAAAIDRVVHHARILEFGPQMTSMRAEQAAQRQQLPPAQDSPAPVAP